MSTPEASAPSPRGAEGGIPLHNLLGFEVHPEPDGPISRVDMPVRAESFGVNDNLHGGALATLVDLTSALAAVRKRTIDLEVESLVTADIHIRYLGQPRTDTMMLVRLDPNKDATSALSIPRDLRVTTFGNRVQEAGAGVVSLGGLYANPISALRRTQVGGPAAAV